MKQARYKLRSISPVKRAPVSADRELLITWVTGFGKETGDHIEPPRKMVEERLPLGAFWIWEIDSVPVSMAALTAPVVGAARVYAVYTPNEHRNCGYGSASVAALSSIALEQGSRCMLYTDLGNPTSNSIYRKIGYEAVAECLRYAFGA